MILNCLIFTIFATNIFVGAFLESCDYLKKDIVFVLDASNSISKENLTLSCETVKKMIFDIKIGERYNRVALILFGLDIVLKFNIDDGYCYEEIAKELDSVDPMQSMTAIGGALQKVLVDVVGRMRKSATKLVFLFTDGTNNIFPAPYTIAEKLKDKGVQIICVGIGDGVDEKEMKRIASPNLFIPVPDFNKLQPIVGKAMSHLCPITEPLPPKPCELDKLDFVIVQDSSGSITDKDYKLSKAFAINMYSQLASKPDSSRFAFVQFSDKVKTEFNLDTYNNINDVKRHVEGAKKFGSTTGIGSALVEVETKILPKKRRFVDLLVLLVTDGYNNQWPRPEKVAERLKEAGVKLVTLGIGDGVKVTELTAIASDKKYFTIDKYTEIMDWTTRVGIMSALTCEDY